MIGMREIRARLLRLERQDWWLWGVAIVVMLLLTVAVFSFSAPRMLEEETPSFQYRLGEAMRGLSGLVLLFALHVIYQQILVKRLRRQLANQIEMMAKPRSSCGAAPPVGPDRSSHRPL